MSKIVGLGMTLSVQDAALVARQLENDCLVGPDINDAAAAIDVTGIDSTSDETLVGRSKGNITSTYGFNAAANRAHAVYSTGRGIARQVIAVFKDSSGSTVATYTGTFLHLGYRVTRAGNGALTVPISQVNAPASSGVWS